MKKRRLLGIIATVLFGTVFLCAQEITPKTGGSSAATFVFTGVLASIPATCTVGQLAFITNATAGQNIYECASTNAWTQQLAASGTGTPGGAGTALQYRVNGTTFGGVLGSTVDNTIPGAGVNIAQVALSQTWTSSDNAHSLHLLEPTATFNGATQPNTFATTYSTLSYQGSAGSLHNGAVMGRTQDGGSGVTPVTNFDNFYADHFSTGTPTGPVTKYTFFNSGGGTVTGGAGNVYAWVCGFCYGNLGAAGSTAFTLETGVDVQMPGLADARKTSLVGVSIGGGRNGTGNYDALIVDTGESIFKQGIKQSLILDSTLFAAPITQGGIPVSGIVAGFYQSNFATAAQTSANINSLLTAGNGITGTMYGAKFKVDNGGNGLVALINPMNLLVSNSGGATSTEADALIVETPLNSAATLTTTRGVYIKTQASGTQTNTPVAIETAGAADLVKFAGPTITNGGHGTAFTAQTTITAGAAVKVDTANNGSVVLCATGDTTGCSGFAQNAATAGQTVYVLTTGNISTPILGTSTCTKGQFVIADTTTAGRVKCTGTYAAGTVLGWVTVAQAVVGSAVGVEIQVR